MERNEHAATAVDDDDDHFLLIQSNQADQQPNHDIFPPKAHYFSLSLVLRASTVTLIAGTSYDFRS